MESIVIVGSGRHTITVIDAIEAEGKYRIEALLCDYGKVGDIIMNYPLMGDLSLLKGREIPKKGIIAIGDNFYRESNVKKIKEICPEFKYINTIHPMACLGRKTEIAYGNVIHAGVILRSLAKIGSHCFINSNSCIGHDAQLRDYVSIGFGVVIGGLVEISKGTAINMGASIRDRIKIGENSVVGMGSVVTCDIDSFAVAYGSPAKVVCKRQKQDGFL